MDKKPMVIAVNAVSGGGKTAVTNALTMKLENSRAIFFDSYDDADKHIPDILQWVEDGADYDLWHLENMAEDVRKLLFESKNIDYVIIDYPFGYKQKQIAGFIDLSIYIDTPLDIALARRIIRDISIQTKVDEIIRLLTGYLTSRDAYCFLQLSNEDADYKIDGSLSVDVITDIIIQKIKEFEI